MCTVLDGGKTLVGTQTEHKSAFINLKWSSCGNYLVSCEAVSLLVILVWLILQAGPISLWKYNMKGELTLLKRYKCPEKIKQIIFLDTPEKYDIRSFESSNKISDQVTLLFASEHNIYKTLSSSLNCELKLSGNICDFYSFGNGKYAVLMEDMSLVTLVQEDQALKQQASVYIIFFNLFLMF